MGKGSQSNTFSNMKHEVFAKVKRKDGTIEDLGLIATTSPIKNIKLDIVAKVKNETIGTLGSLLLDPQQSDLILELQAYINKYDESIKNIGTVCIIPIDVNKIIKRKD